VVRRKCGAVEFELSNGMCICCKRTDFVKHSVSFQVLTRPLSVQCPLPEGRPSRGVVLGLSPKYFDLRTPASALVIPSVCCFRKYFGS
jgi:hypothetical protein